MQAHEMTISFEAVDGVHAETAADMFKVKGGKDSVIIGVNYTCTCKATCYVDATNPELVLESAYGRLSRDTCVII